MSEENHEEKPESDSIKQESSNSLNLVEKTSSENLNKINTIDENESDNINHINTIEEDDKEALLLQQKLTEEENEKLEKYIKQEGQHNTKAPKVSEEDMLTQKFEARNDDDKYLVHLENSDKDLQNILPNENNSSDEEDDNDEETFPFRIIGDVQKKGETLGFFNHRYLEIDSVKGILKRYKSSKEYPRYPLEIIPIKTLKLLKKLKKEDNLDYYDFQISYTQTRGNKSEEKIQTYRVRHPDCRTKWFDSLLALWKHLVRGTPIPKISANKLLFVDDLVGIIQEIRQNDDKSKKKTGKVTLRNFKILGLLGIGGFSTVYKVQHIMTEKIYAMKVMNKNYIIFKKYLHYVVSEFEIMKNLSGFPFVLDLHYCFQSANYLYMIIDYCPNGDFTNLKSINNLKLFFAELILAFEHIHTHNTVYRDLKPENIILDVEGHMKICDFNLAKSGITKDKKALSFCGSPMYLSPDMLTGKGVDGRCDIYGIGLIMYELISGIPTFCADNIKVLYDNIKSNKINYNVPNIKGDVKDLIQKILVADPDKRISIEEIKKHPYFKDIDFEKVLKKEYGPILTKKRPKDKLVSPGTPIDPIEDGEEYFKNDKNAPEDPKQKKIKEKVELIKFRQQQQKLDADKNFTFLDGKISVKEMKKDQKRAMKNYVREFYFVKKEDVQQTQDFHLTVNSQINTQGIINNK